MCLRPFGQVRRPARNAPVRPPHASPAQFRSSCPMSAGFQASYRRPAGCPATIRGWPSVPCARHAPGNPPGARLTRYSCSFVMSACQPASVAGRSGGLQPSPLPAVLHPRARRFVSQPHRCAVGLPVFGCKASASLQPCAATSPTRPLCARPCGLAQPRLFPGGAVLVVRGCSRFPACVYRSGVAGPWSAGRGGLVIEPVIGKPWGAAPNPARAAGCSGAGVRSITPALRLACFLLFRVKGSRLRRPATPALDALSAMVTWRTV